MLSVKIDLGSVILILVPIRHTTIDRILRTLDFHVLQKLY